MMTSKTSMTSTTRRTSKTSMTSTTRRTSKTSINYSNYQLSIPSGYAGILPATNAAAMNIAAKMPLQ